MLLLSRIWYSLISCLTRRELKWMAVFVEDETFLLAGGLANCAGQFPAPKLGLDLNHLQVNEEEHFDARVLYD